MRTLHEINKERFALIHELSLEFMEKHLHMNPESIQYENLHNEFVHKNSRVMELNEEARLAWHHASQTNQFLG